MHQSFSATHAQSQYPSSNFTISSLRFKHLTLSLIPLLSITQVANGQVQIFTHVNGLPQWHSPTTRPNLAWWCNHLQSNPWPSKFLNRYHNFTILTLLEEHAMTQDRRCVRTIASEESTTIQGQNLCDIYCIKRTCHDMEPKYVQYLPHIRIKQDNDTILIDNSSNSIPITL